MPYSFPTCQTTHSATSSWRPHEREPTTPFDKLLQRLAYGERDPDLISSVAARIARLDKRITKEDRAELEETTGVRLSDLAHVLVDALDPDRHLAEAQRATGKTQPTPEEITEAASDLLDAAGRPFDNSDLRTKLVEIRRSYEQLIDEASKDVVVRAGFSVDAAERARRTIESFQQFIEDHKDEITALQVLYSRPYSQRLKFKDIKELAHAIGRPPHRFTPEKVWQAYETLDRSKVRGSPGRVLTNIVSLVRFALHQDDELVPFPRIVHQRFDTWIAQQEASGRGFTDEQRAWLERIRDHIAASLTITVDDFEAVPFVQHGGLGKAYELFGEDLSPLLDELTSVLAA